MSETQPPIRANLPLLLASGSRYRAELLARLQIPFSTQNVALDERPEGQETPDHRAQRLATAKSQAAITDAPKQWVLGSDQVAALGEQQLGKPGTVEAAMHQLQMMSGQQMQFWTAASLWNPASGKLLQHLDCTTVTMRQLQPAEIERYLLADQPLDCAGSFKMEALGVSLFERVETEDPTALIGLPLIGVCRLLRQIGQPIP